MDHENRCGFCRNLPPASPAKTGRPGKCPLCKGDLLVAPDGGQTFRVVPDLDLPFAKIKIAALALVGLLAIGLGGGWAFLRSATGDGRTINPQVAAVIPVSPRFQETPSSPAPVSPLRAKAKPSRFFPEPEAKKETYVIAQVQEVTRPVPVVQEPIKPVPNFFEEPSLSPIVSHTPDKEILQQLELVPELDLISDFSKKTRKEIKALGDSIVKKNGQGPDAFVRELIKDRQDLAGLPFLLGKECTLDEKKANVLKKYAVVARRIPFRETFKNDLNDYHYWEKIPDLQEGKLNLVEGHPAFMQIWGPEHPANRLMLARTLMDFHHPQVTRALARLAVFDINPAVRQAALLALKDRPKEDIAPVVLQGFRYPWLPVVKNAARTTAMLNLKDLAPDLNSLMEQPDPGTPYFDSVKKQWVVRELVRVNHHRNCLLCHAPREKKEGIVLGVIPTPDRELSLSSQVYYAERRGGILVKAETTYLRQDFSLMQKAGVQIKGWPKLQRYDFLIRVRPLNKDEVKKFQKRKTGPLSDYKFLLQATLRDLEVMNSGMMSALQGKSPKFAGPRPWTGNCLK